MLRSGMDVADWLRTLGFEALIEAFARERIDAETLLHLDADDLKELGVATLGERKRLLAAIRSLREAARDDAGSGEGDASGDAGEQREVTVVFGDLCGFTALSRRLGAEATHELLRRLFARLDAVVASHGGSVDKHIGDAVMAVFGAPRAHGDDPERAVAAALAMVEATRTLGRETGETLALHVGVASGSVVSARTAADPTARPELTGDAVNLAARLTDHAPPEAVLLCAATRAACAQRVETGFAGEHMLKGFQAPVPSWRAIALVPTASTPGEQEAPIVGRAVELAQFAAACAAVRAQGRATVLVLRGEAGIGKSRLAREFVQRAIGSGFAAHAGRFADFGDPGGRHALRAVARSLLGMSIDDGADAQAESGARPTESGVAEYVCLREFAGVPLDPARRAILAAMDSTAQREATYEALARLVREASMRAPAVILLEDLHWAQPSALDAVLEIVRRVADSPVALVLTTRAENEPARGWRDAVGSAALVTLDLGPLQPQEAAALAAQQASLPPERVAHCLARAEGHPLFLEQLLRHVQEDVPTALPASLLSIVLARMDALDERDRGAMHAAAILGQVVELDALRFLLARPRYRPDALLQAGLLRETREGLVFRHALIRDGALAALLGARRRALHARAATWFAGRDPTQHAEHLDRAGDARAPAAFAAAAKTARARRRLEEAVRLARRGMALATAASDAHALARLLGDTLRDLGDAQGSLTACLAAVESAEDGAPRAEALLAAAETMRIMDRLDEALGCVAAADRIAAARGLTGLMAQAAHLRGNLHFPRGESEQCLAAHARASALAEESGAPQLVALSEGGLGDAFYALGQMRSAATHFARCIEVARAHGLMRIEAANAPMLAFIRMLQATPSASDAEAEHAIALARDVGHPRAGIVAHHAVVQSAIWRLDLDRAEAHVAEARALARRAGAWRFEAENLAFLGDIRRLQGRRDEALALLAEGVAIARRTGLRYFGPIILGNLALATADPIQRHAALAEGEALLTEGALAHNLLFFRERAIEVAIEDHDAASLRRHADALAASFAEPIGLCDFLVSRARALADRLEAPASGTARATLGRVRDAARDGGWRAFLPAIERALRETDAVG